MKYLLITLTAFFIANHSQAQIVQTVNDANKLETVKQFFINKPLKKLLQEIKPEIKFAGIDYLADSEDAYRNITFKFIDFDWAVNRNLRPNMPLPVTIIVYIKEKFDWNDSARVANKHKWTPQDVIEFGDLTVVDIWVYGQQ